MLEVRSTSVSSLRTSRSSSRSGILSIVTNGSLLERRKNGSSVREAEGEVKGRDLSGLDCVLIEVTCIKWNLIGTDTGSLTDRHDADGLRGGR